MKRSIRRFGIFASVALTLFMSNTVFGQADVNVVNDSSRPVPVINVNDGRQIFQKWVGTGMPANNTATQLNLVTVPDGKRLVIEFASFLGTVPQGQRISHCRLTAIAGGEIFNLFPVTTQLPDYVFGEAAFGATQTVKLYADENTTVRAYFNRSGTTGTSNVQVSIAGYLIDMP